VIKQICFEKNYLLTPRLELELFWLLDSVPLPAPESLPPDLLVCVLLLLFLLLEELLLLPFIPEGIFVVLFVEEFEPVLVEPAPLFSAGLFVPGITLP
jgi:hypothetical protein